MGKYNRREWVEDNDRKESHLLESGGIDDGVVVDDDNLLGGGQLVQDEAVDGHHLPREVVVRVAEFEL